MPKRETFNDFVRKFGKTGELVERLVLKPWNNELQFTITDVGKFVPIASGALRDSIKSVKARVTDSGIVSYIESRIPYAKRLHNAPDGEVQNWKRPGELSYHDGGQRITKKQRGTNKFISRAINIHEKYFMDIVSKAVSKAFNWA